MATEAAELPPCSPPDQEGLDFSTTLDPSYIIQLIRQLLASNGIEKSMKRPNLLIEDATTAPCINESQDTEAICIHQPEFEGSCSAQARKGSMQSNAKLVHDQADACGNLGIHHISCHKVHEKVEEVQPETVQGEGSGPRKSDGSGQRIDQTIDEKANSPQGLNAMLKTPEERTEEAGCILWDLAANQSHAEFMVKNHILDVLLALLGATHSDRLREVSLGILGNLACHAEPVKAIVRTHGLAYEIIQSLFVDDSPILSETCRFLSASLHSDQSDSWVKALDSQEILERVMWIAANTMNSLLLEKSTELLLAMVDYEGSTASVLLSSLVRLGLPAVLADLLASEVTAFSKGMCSHGNIVLDTILQIAEAVSLGDYAARQLAENSEIFMLACQVIQLSGEEEVGPAAVTAMVLVANLLAEREDLIHEVCQDLVLIQQLLELLPTTASDDPGARNACWSILGRLSFEAASCGKGSHLSTEMALVFARGSKVLLRDLQEHTDTEYAEEVEHSKGFFTSKLETVDSFLHVMKSWMNANRTNEKESQTYKMLEKSSSALKIWLKTTKQEKILQIGGKDMLENGK